MNMTMAGNSMNYRKYLLTLFCLLAATLIGVIRYLTGSEIEALKTEVDLTNGN